MKLAAQILSGLLAAFLAFNAILYVFNPMTAAEASGLNPTTDFGVTNVRMQGASMLMLAIAAGIGAWKQNWLFLVPSVATFLFVALIRVFGMFADGVDPGTIRGLVLALVLFAVAEFAAIVFRRSERQAAGV